MSDSDLIGLWFLFIIGTVTVSAVGLMFLDASGFVDFLDSRWINFKYRRKGPERRLVRIEEDIKDLHKSRSSECARLSNAHVMLCRLRDHLRVEEVYTPEETKEAKVVIRKKPKKK